MTTNHYTDEELQFHLVSGSPGDRNSAHHLLTVPEDIRPAIVSKAHIRRNVEPGWTYSAAVRQECADYNSNPEHYRRLIEEESPYYHAR